MSGPKPLNPIRIWVALWLTLAFALVAVVRLLISESEVREKRIKINQCHTEFMEMKTAFDKMEDINRRLETQVLLCQTNFQFLINALAGQKPYGVK